MVDEINGEGGTGEFDQCLKPRKPISRDVVYEIPAGAGNLKLRYERTVVSSEQVDGAPVGTDTVVYTLAL